MAHNPLAQFEIKPLVQLSLFGYDISFSNSSLFMMSAVIIVCISLLLGVRKTTNIPSRLQALSEMMYQLISNMLEQTIGNNGRKFVPFIFSIFCFILMCNLLGLIPYGFTATSHIVVTFVLAMIVFVSINVIGVYKHGVHFFSLFLPKGTPWWLAPLMVIIELFAYLARPISLSLRLAANMTAGHVLLKVIAGFIVSLFVLFKPLPISLVVVLIGFELFVAILQAYIFAVLSCVYLNDAINLH